MSKNDVATKDETAVAVSNFHPVNAVPDKAPLPQMDLDNPNLSFDDVLPSNYFSMEDLQIWLDEREAEHDEECDEESRHEFHAAGGEVLEVQYTDESIHGITSAG